MSVTVADLLNLPSLRQAKVLGGRNGLGKIVSSISVLESVDPGILIDPLFPQGEFYGSEIVITGFLNCRDDVQRQCDNLRRLAQGGEVGLILYYVGIYMPKVDPKLIQLADELDFVLICMPEGEQALRYGEVINDVTACIFRDQAKQNSIVLDILERVSALPKHQQSVNTVMKMLSDRICATVILCDAAFHILNLVTWPRSTENRIKEEMERLRAFPSSGGSIAYPFAGDCRLYRNAIKTDSGQTMELLLLKAGLPLETDTLSQIADAARICINIWGRKHGEVAIHELVRAILQDEPMKMYRLAEIFHIDIAAIHEMWILDSGQTKEATAYKEQLAWVKEYLSSFKGTFVADIYGDRLLLFLSTPPSLQEAEQMLMDILKGVAQQDANATLTRCSQLMTTGDVRAAYQTYKEHLGDARKIFPLQRIFTGGDMEFVSHCRQLIQKDEAGVKQCLAPLAYLQKDDDEMNLQKTLAVFLLDGASSVTKTAQLLYLHKNTVKYRIKRIADLLGYHPGKMPEAAALYQAVAVQRLLN
jgi:DNA-binding PucR family transcriptional regulator